MHKFTLLLKKESRSIIAFAILSAILVTLLLLDFDKNLFSEIFHDICVYTREFVGYSTVFCILVLLFLIFSRYGTSGWVGRRPNQNIVIFLGSRAWSWQGWALV